MRRLQQSHQYSFGKTGKTEFLVISKNFTNRRKMGNTCFEQYRMGYASKLQRKKLRDLNSQIQNLKNRFESRIIALVEFWTNLSDVCQNVQ